MTRRRWILLTVAVLAGLTVLAVYLSTRGDDAVGKLPATGDFVPPQVTPESVAPSGARTTSGTEVDDLLARIRANNAVIGASS